jgi:iron(III) transport system substrate-binding protein
MFTEVHRAAVLLLILAAGFLVPSSGFADELPKSTRDILKQLKMEPSVLGDLDMELDVPKDWIEKAKKEGKVRVMATWDTAQTRSMYAPFRERYPFIQVEYSAGRTREQRATRTLLAYKSGQILIDVLAQVGGAFAHFKDADAVENLAAIPGVKNLPGTAKDPEGLWAGMYSIYICIAYNTKLVKKDELPKDWDGLTSNPRWRQGNLAINNRPNLGPLHLWQAKGERWTTEFLEKLFTEVKPQLRKEGTGTMLQLLAPGEFHAAFPAFEYATYEVAREGAPVSLHCPVPVPADIQNILILKRSPNSNAARIFVNWLLSKEGQLAQFSVADATPVHRDLMKPEFVRFGDQILGKEAIYLDPRYYVTVLPKLEKLWNQHWKGER